MVDKKHLQALFGDNQTDPASLSSGFLAIAEHLREVAGAALKSGDILGTFRALTYACLADRNGPTLSSFCDLVDQLPADQLLQLLRLGEMWLDPRFTSEDSVTLTAKILAKLGFASSAQYLASRSTQPAVTPQRPKVIMYGLECGGSSAIHPIVEEILTSQFGYASFWGPAETERYRPFQNLPIPTLHWTHHGVEEFSALITAQNTKFLCLFRDPRDAVISEMKINLAEFQKRMPGASEAEILMHNISELGPRLERANKWRALNQSNVFHYTFEQLKANVPLMARRIFEFLQLEVDPQIIDQVCHKHAFENVTKRARGEQGAIIGQGSHMYRKGVAGGWIKDMDPPVIRYFAESYGDVLRSWGYPLYPEVQGPLAIL